MFSSLWERSLACVSNGVLCGRGTQGPDEAEPAVVGGEWILLGVFASLRAFRCAINLLVYALKHFFFGGTQTYDFFQPIW